MYFLFGEPDPGGGELFEARAKEFGAIAAHQWADC
jgi:hypothetical protein